MHSDRVHHRDHRQQPRHAIAGLGRGMTQLPHLARQAAQEAPVEADVGIVEHQRRLADPGDDPARRDLGAPGGGVARASQRDPFVDQRARIGAGDAGIGGAQMAQPAEAVQRHRPVLGRRLDLERRAGVAHHHLAAEREAAGIDLARAGGIGGAQILRRNEQPVGRAGQERQPRERKPGQPAEQLASHPPREKHGQSGPFRDRSARHRGVGSPHCGRAIASRGRTIPERRDGGQPTVRLRRAPSGRRRSRRARPFVDWNQGVGRAACAGRRRRPGTRRGHAPRSPQPDAGARGNRTPASRPPAPRPRPARANRCNRR